MVTVTNNDKIVKALESLPALLLAVVTMGLPRMDNPY